MDMFGNGVTVSRFPIRAWKLTIFLLLFSSVFFYRFVAKIDKLVVSGISVYRLK